jgi:hypothetical protein
MIKSSIFMGIWIVFLPAQLWRPRLPPPGLDVHGYLSCFLKYKEAGNYLSPPPLPAKIYTLDHAVMVF